MDQPFPFAVPSRPARSVPVPRTRPRVVSILAVLHVLGGVALLVMIVGFGRQFGAIGPVMGTSPLFAQLSVSFLGVLTLASGVGMWRGAAWGWWLAGFYYVYAIYRNANALLVISSMADQLAGEARGPGYYYVKHVGRVVTHSLVLFYLFQESVLAYFGLPHLDKRRALVQLAKPIAILVVVQLLATLW